jgi:hypothetical protein
MKLVPPTLLVLLSIILMTGYSQDNKSGQKKQSDFKIQEGTGDPPVTLYDGSLDAYSRAGWKDNLGNNPTVINPLPSNGSLHPTGCDLHGSEMMGDNHNTSAYLAFIDSAGHTESWDIAPAPGKTTTITITHDTAGANRNDPRIVVKVPSTGAITMETKADSWDGNPAAAHRAHHRKGHVEEIVITGSASHDGDWKPKDPKNPQVRLGFCFK